MPYDLTTMQSIYHGQDEIVEIKHNNVSVYQKSSGPDYTEPFTIEMIESGSITISNSNELTIKYQINNGTVISTNQTNISITGLLVGDKIKFYGNNAGYGTGNSASLCTVINSTAKHDAYGNIMSLISETNFESLTSFTTDYVFAYLFQGDTGLRNAKDLLLPVLTFSNVRQYSSMFSDCASLLTPPKLPATTLSSCCYANCFRECTSLLYAPVLPATTIADESYSKMFWNCITLTEAPVLPATTITNRSYQYMFYGCSNITTAPQLPATNLSQESYKQMFYGCSKLNNIKCLATSGINSNNSTSDWVKNVSSTGTFTKAAGVTWPTGTSGIPSGWTVIEV